jgi:hypothetical protein
MNKKNVITFNMIKDLLIILWEFIPRFTKIAAVIILAEMTAVIMVANSQDRFGLIIAFLLMAPFVLFVFLMSIIEPHKKTKEKI